MKQVPAKTTETADGKRAGRTAGKGYQEVSASIVIDAPINDVWAVTTDPSVFPEAIDWVFEARWEDDAPVGEGSTYLERGKPGLREGTYRWEITAWEPPYRSIHSHESGELDAELEIFCKEIDDETTRYTQVLRFRAMPSFRPLGFVLERTVMKRQMRRDFEEMILPNFKRIAEARAAEA